MNSGILRSCKCSGSWDTMRRAAQHHAFCVASEGTESRALFQGLTEKKQVYTGVCEGGKGAVNKEGSTWETIFKGRRNRQPGLVVKRQSTESACRSTGAQAVTFLSGGYGIRV